MHVLNSLHISTLDLKQQSINGKIIGLVSAGLDPGEKCNWTSNFDPSCWHLRATDKV